MRITLTRRRRQGHASQALGGFPPLDPDSGRVVDHWSTSQLGELNELLPWACFTVDGLGRRVGSPASREKRWEPQPLPDPRITRLDAEIPLHDRHVLEVGCFEGVHTVALCERAREVTAVDARVPNLVKTLTRTWLYGHRPTVALLDVEDPGQLELFDCDVLHHNGVLYHLVDPVGHLRRALPRVRHGLLLDTHVSTDAEATSTYAVDDQEFRIKEFREHPDSSPFAGMHTFARWLLLDDLREELIRAGFTVLVEELREERNGQRVLFMASRTEALLG